MHFNTVLGGAIAIFAAVVSAAPYEVSLSKRASAPANAQTVVYWGQNGGGTIEDNNLAAYCTSNSGINVIVLAFLYQYGNGNLMPSGQIGQSCGIQSGQGQNCDALASSIATCQSRGIKIILSLGGAIGQYTLKSTSEAEAIATNLWKSYGNSGDTSAPRPFGKTFVNGFDFDIEVQSNPDYYPAMIAKLRQLFATDAQNQYYITGAPQCPIPEPNMGDIIQNSQFDYLFVQFYNNNAYAPDPCSLGQPGNAPMNYNSWVSFIASTKSSQAKIFIGVPASPLAANGSPSGEVYYATPTYLASLVQTYGSTPAFGGIMMWSAGFSDSNVVNGCTYAQQAHNILLTGAPCGSSGPPPPITTSTTSSAVPTKTSSPTSTPTSSAPAGTGTPLPQWAQCGGQGYTGSTNCASPYKCVATSIWWSQCE